MMLVGLWGAERAESSVSRKAAVWVALLVVQTAERLVVEMVAMKAVSLADSKAVDSVDESADLLVVMRVDMKALLMAGWMVVELGQRMVAWKVVCLVAPSADDWVVVMAGD